MFKNKKLTNIVCMVVVIVAIVYLFRDIFKANNIRYETEQANVVTIQDIVELDAFIVRDERFVDEKAEGTIVPLVADGDRVASGDAIARICSTEEAASDYAELEETIKLRDRYMRLNEQTELKAMDMEKLNEDIDKAYTELLDVISSRNYDGLDEYVSELEESYASKQVLREGSIDLTETLDTLNKRIAELEAKKIAFRNVAAPLSGYYISHLDGHELTLRYEDIDSLTVSLVNSTLKQEPKAAAEKLGKLVTSHKWYIIANVDSSKAHLMTLGNTMEINIPEYGYEGVKVKVEKISDAQDGKVAIALSCNEMNEIYANMRRESIELVMKEYTGYRIRTSAIHSYVPPENTTEKGKGDETTTTTTTTAETTEADAPMSVVYIIRDRVMNARRVEVIYTDGDYSIVDTKTKWKDGVSPIQRYDEVIVKGRDLKNGKSVG